MNSELSDTELPLDEQLVAYLDGELDAESGRRIEALLASDPEVRRRLQSLERTWDLLDELDAAPVGEPFTQTTLEMVAVAAHDDVERDRAEAPRRRRRWRWIVAGSLLAVVAAGFLAVAALWPDPNRQLLDDLPVLDNFDEYRQVESVEFLRELRDKGLFPAKDADRPQSEAAAVEDLPARRQRIEQMGLAEKEELLRSEERFTALPPAEQQRLRRLHDELQNGPDAEQLRAIMRRYCTWLRTLPSYSGTELAELTPAQRAEWVEKRLQEERRRAGGRRPGDKDMEALWSWMSEWATHHESQFLKTLPEPRQKELAKLNKPDRHRNLLWDLGRRWQEAGPDKPPPMMTDDDLARLRAQLTAETRKQLENLSTAEQWQRVAVWMRQWMRRPGPGRGMRGQLPRPDDERLADFFEELTDEERDPLLALPGDEMQRRLQQMWRLQQMYLRRNGPAEGPRFRPEGPIIGPWPDDGPPRRESPREPPKEPQKEPPKQPPKEPRPPEPRRLP